MIKSERIKEMRHTLKFMHQQIENYKGDESVNQHRMAVAAMEVFIKQFDND